MRLFAVALLFLNACVFNPKVDGESLVACETAEDCPRSGLCVGGYCVSEPLAITGISASPEVVEVGDDCSFEVDVSHSQLDEKLFYQWRVVRGPGVELTGRGTDSVSLTTEDDYVGTYALEVTVQNEIDPPATATVFCTAINETDAAYVVAGRFGDCTKNDPCDSISEAMALDPRPVRLYLGVEGGSDEVWYYGSNIDDRFNDGEIHGGFLYPEWKRDPVRARTSVTDWGRSLQPTCTNCVISGIYVYSLNGFGGNGVYLSTVDVTLRELDVVLGGGREDASIAGIEAQWGFNISGLRLEGVRITADPRGTIARHIVGLLLRGAGAHISHSTIDLTMAETETKLGMRISGDPSAGAAATVDSLRITTGGATEEVVGLRIACATAQIWNTIVDTRGSVSSDSIALMIEPTDPACPGDSLVHSSLFMGGESERSRALEVGGQLSSFTLVNTILDGGDGFSRTGIKIDQGALQSDQSYEFPGTVIVFEGDNADRDSPGGHGAALLELEELNELLACEDCPVVATTSAFLDREGGDFHLTAESSCCVGQGEAIDEDGPAFDFDGVARPASNPEIGPYQLVTP